MQEIRERDLRNVALFGAEGQRRLRGTKVLVAGGGGLGSPLAQHLALLGVGEVGTVDDEDLDNTNRNRFIGARHDDPVPGSPKVGIIARLVKEIDPDVAVRPVPHPLMSEEAFQAVREADWVFGCFDEDGPRAVLNELCIAYDKPYIDLASDVPEPNVFGGRVTISMGGTGCLRCLGLLDQLDLRDFFATDDQRTAEAKIYGIDRAVLGEKGPSVSPINGVVASLAATEFMAAATGLRAPIPNIEYRGHQAKVVVVKTQADPDCPICAMRGLGAAAQVERYLSLTYLRERRAQKTKSRI